MKTHFLVLIAAVASAAWLAGCSKSANPTAQGGGTPGTATANAAGGTLFKVKWQPGKRYVNVVTNHQSADINVPGMKEPLKQETSMSQQFAVSVNKPLDDGGAELGMEVVSYLFDQTTGGRSHANFDSANDPSTDRRNPLAPFLRKMVGSKLTFTVDADGRVAGVEGVDDLLARMREGAQPDVAAALETLVSEDQFKELLDEGRMMPTHAVNTGDSWPVNIQLKIAAVGRLTLNLECTYKGMEQHGDRNCARIDFTGTMSSKPISGADSIPISAEINKGKLTGQSWFDPDLGVVVDNIGEQTFAAKINANGQKLTATFVQTTGGKLIEVADTQK